MAVITIALRSHTCKRSIDRSVESLRGKCGESTIPFTCALARGDTQEQRRSILGRHAYLYFCVPFGEGGGEEEE